MKPKVIVLGGGVAGLSTALHLIRTGEFDVEVVEKSDRVGGLATSFQLGSAIFDFGPHAFHSQEPAVIQFFQDLMRGAYYEIFKNVAIKFDEKLYPYPLNPVKALRNMPFSGSLRCGLSYAWNSLTNHRSLERLQTAEEFFVRNFGWELYRIFFEGYTHKVWGIHPRDLSAEFIKNRLPPASLFRIVWTALTGRDIKVRKTHEVPLKLRIFYPKRGSIEFPKTMANEIERNGGRLHLRCSVDSVEMKDGKAHAVTFRSASNVRRAECQYVVSTIPITDLIRCFTPPPAPEIVASARRLTFRPILIACLWINKPEIFPFQTIYYTNRIFNRLAQMNSYSPETAPPSTCGVTAELTCQLGDAHWTMKPEDLLTKIVADMKVEELIREDEVKDAMVLRNEHGYPVYQIGFEEHLLRIREAIHDIPNLFIGGRQGMFNYAQMHYGVNSGRAITEHIVQGKPKRPLPKQDLEEQFFA